MVRTDKHFSGRLEYTTIFWKTNVCSEPIKNVLCTKMDNIGNVEISNVTLQIQVCLNDHTAKHLSAHSSFDKKLHRGFIVCLLTVDNSHE